MAFDAEYHVKKVSCFNTVTLVKVMAITARAAAKKILDIERGLSQVEVNILGGNSWQEITRKDII